MGARPPRQPHRRFQLRAGGLAANEGSRLGTKLKVMGVELASMGETKPASPADEVVVYREPKAGIYKKLIVREG